MPLESATYISDLDPSNPVGSSDLVSSLDDHMRLVKATLQTTFPGIEGAVTATHTELNHLDGVTGATGTGKLVLDDAPTIADLTVTDSITLPAASVADAALSSNVPLLNTANTFTSRQNFVHGSQFMLDLQNTSAPENCGRWQVRVQASDGALEVRSVDDALGTLGIPIDLAHDESGTTYISLTAPILDFNGNADISGTLNVGGNATAARLRTGQGSDASLSSTNHPLQLGLSDGPNLIADINEIMARNDGAAADLAINIEGGNVQIGHSSATVSIGGAFSVTGAATAGTAATSTSATLVAGQIHNRSSNTTVNNLGAGRWVAVQNTSTSAITLSQGSGVTLELGGTTTTGNRTLGPKGFAFIYFRANNTATVQGSGVS